MDRVGTFALALALGLALYGAVASALGARRNAPALVESARTTAYSLFAVVIAANAAMLWAIITEDFAVRYVADNSSRATPTFFKVLSLWSADEGSLLLWNLILAGFIAAVAIRFRRERPETFPWAMTVMFIVSIFYLGLVLGPTKPFALSSVVPPDGRGPLPLLQNHPLMAVHPPMLYLGFIGMTVPFAFAMAALVTGNLSDAWIRLTRRWTLVAWCFLGAGLLLGSMWSYGVLGWGGYWAWDPVENVALLPWLMATAFLHSVMIQERRGMLKVWNLSLIVGAFALTTFGTFLTRGSILASVHAFAKSIVGPLYLGFLVLIIAAGFGLIALRASRLASEGRFDSLLSRESAFLGNNVALLALTLTVLVGTIFPLAAEAVTNRQVTIGGPYFRETTIPVFLLLLFLMGVGPLLPWRRGDPEQVRSRLILPAIVGGVAVVGLAIAGMRDLAALAGYGLAAFVGVANAALIARGVRSFARSSGRGLLRSAPAAVARNRRLFGGLVAHLGVAVAVVAITTSSAFARQTEVSLKRGRQTTFAGYTLRYEDAQLLTQPQRLVAVADVAASRNGRSIGTLTPSLNFYPSAADAIGTPSIHYSIVKDLYASLVQMEPRGVEARFRFFVNPGVTWLWVGGAVIVLGGVLAAWPSRRRRYKAIRAMSPDHADSEATQGLPGAGRASMARDAVGKGGIQS